MSILRYGSFVMLFACGVPCVPCVAEESPRQEWTRKMCEETATISEASANYTEVGCYGMVGKRTDIFEACYPHSIDFSKGCKSSYGSPPIVFAVRNLDVQAIDRLVLKGVDVKGSFATPWGNGSLMIIAVAKCRDDEILAANCASTLRRLLELGVAVNGDPGTDTPLIIAAANSKNVELVKVLLDAGAEINHKNRYGHTAWDWARMPGGSRKVADYLESRGATGDPFLKIKQNLFEAMWPPGQH